MGEGTRSLAQALRESPNLLRPSNPKGPQHVLEAQQFNRQLLTELFYMADRLVKEPYLCMQGKHVIFHSDELTTRTRTSTAEAIRSLGGTMDFVNGKESSEGKGESLEDTIIAYIANGAAAIAIRYHDEMTIYRAAKVSSVPIINAGTGTGQHPTQTLADLFTIFKKCGRLDRLKILIMGDLLLSRVVHSDLYALAKFDGNRIILAAPHHLWIRGDLAYYLSDKGIDVIEVEDFEPWIGQVDVVIQTRGQHERTDDKSFHDALADYRLTARHARMMKPGAGIMHALPRKKELSREIDPLPQNWYHQQMANGRFIRAALFAKIFG